MVRGNKSLRRAIARRKAREADAELARAELAKSHWGRAWLEGCYSYWGPSKQGMRVLRQRVPYEGDAAYQPRQTFSGWYHRRNEHNALSLPCDCYVCSTARPWAAVLPFEWALWMVQRGTENPPPDLSTRDPLPRKDRGI